MEIIEYFDSHAHYYDSCFDSDLEEVLKNAYDQGVHKIVDIGTNKEVCEKAIKLATKHDYIYATVGLHPEDIKSDNVQEELIFVNEFAKKDKVVAIGEIGLDYNFSKENKDLQKKYLIEQIHIANKYKLPIVIHNREADMDILDILKNVAKPDVNVVFHCFSSSYEVAKEVIRQGWYISFTGTVTFKNAKNVQEVATNIPLDKIMIETDCPYLSPEPNRGKRNDSANVIYVAKKIAELRGISEKEVAQQTYINACNFYNIHD